MTGDYDVIVLGCSGRHNPAVPDILGDLRRRAEDAPRRDHGRVQGGRRGTTDAELTEGETLRTSTAASTTFVAVRPLPIRPTTPKRGRRNRAH
jgi:hypothetical protein